MPKVIRSTLEGPLEDEHKESRGRKCLHTLVFILLFANDVADFLSDWLFFYDVQNTEAGLVYGPLEPAVVWSLLAFSIVGTITFVFETVNLWWEFFRRNAWIDSDILSAVVIWIEDIPQIAISLYIATCREEAISVFQLTKAAVVIIGIVVRIVVSSVKYCNKKAIKQKHHVKYKIVIMLGVILEFFCAIAIFVLTQTEQRDGSISFKVPETVIEDKFNDQYYFANVSIFAHHDEFFDAGSPHTTDQVVNWMRLVSINNIRLRDHGYVTFNLEFKDQGPKFTLAIWEKHGPDDDPSSHWVLSECYEVVKSSAAITELDNNTCAGSGPFIKSYKAFIKFRYDQPAMFFKKQIFGDIHFNMKLEDNNQCQMVRNYTDSIQKSADNNIPLIFHYYRTNANMSPTGTKHLLHDGSSIRFYRNDGQDLTDITDVWKTGWRRCESTGSLAPNHDSTLPVNCSRT